MPTRESAPIGAPCWIDLLTSDPDQARAFYAEVFGWTAEQGGEEVGGYITFTRNGVPVAGGMGKTPEMGEAPDGWTIYLASDDVQKTADLAVANGGEVTMPPMPIPEDGHLGHMAMIADSAGAHVGIWQAGEHKGFGVLAEPGVPAWFELHTRGFESAVSFYEEVLRWDTHVVSDTPEFRYTTLGEGEGQLAGVMDATSFLPEGVPAHWSVYFAVTDADATVAKITELGGSLVQGPDDTPYGRLVTVTDPTGAMFKLQQPPAD